jgi:hypothetical protein
VRGLACGVEAARRVPLATKVATARHENRRPGGGRAVLNRSYERLPGLRGSNPRVHRKVSLMAAGGRSEPTHWCPRRRRRTSEDGLVRVRLLQPRARGVGTVDEALPLGNAEISASESRSTEAGVRESNASPALPSSANCGGSARASHRRRRCSVTFACNAHANGTGDVIEWLVSGLRAEWETFQSSPTS